MAIVHAENVAQGAVLAATADVAGGKAYNLANDHDVTVRRFFELAGEGLARRPLFVPLPLSVARAALRGTRWMGHALFGSKFSSLSNSSIDFLAEDNPFSSELAKRELGWSPRVRPEFGVPDAFRWWNDERKKERARLSRARL
jgi:nucleoside-diphosphate-sugar epimerase